MKKIISLTLSLIMVFGMITFIAPTVAEASSDKVFYVEAGAKNGNGSATSPFGSIEEARDAIRKLKATDGLPLGGIDVILRDGEYTLVSPIEFTSEDSGTAESPIRYIAENKHAAKLNGGFVLSYSDFKPLSSAEKAKLMDQSSASKIMKLDLAKYGATAELIGIPNGTAFGKNNLAQFFVDGNVQTLSRYPDKGTYLKTTAAADDLQSSFIISDDVKDRIKQWGSYDGAAVYAFTTYDWATHYTIIDSVSEAENKVKVKSGAGYGYGKGSRYYFDNVYAELDAEGEYYIDPDTCTLYAYLPASAKSAELTMTFYNGNVMNINGAEHLTFKDLEISMTRSDTGVLIQSNNVTLDGIKMYGIGGVGMNIRGSNLTVQNCDISGTGEDAIRVYGGDRQTLTPSNNLIYNNYIHHWATKGWTYRPAVRVDGVGIRVSHNEIAYSLHFAIHYYGNDNIIEYNDIHHVTTDSGDAGAIYAGRQWTYYGNVLRYNYIHEIGSHEVSNVKGIYFDDCLSGQIMYGNIIQNVYGSGSWALSNGGGRDNTIFNNIFIDIYDGDSLVSKALQIDSRGRTGAENPEFWFGDTWQYAGQFEEVPYNTGVWAEKYPALAKLKYKKNTFELDDLYAYFNPAFDIIKNNAMYVSGKGPKAMTMSFAEFTYNMAEEMLSSCELTGNTLVAKNLDDFVDAGSGNLKLKSDAKVFTEIPGFFDIPFGDIGLVDKAEAKVMSFDDVKSGDWFYSAAEYAYQNGLMNGTSATMFSPMLKMSRAQLVTVLYRLDGQAMSPVTVPFGDLTQDWYKAAVAWAYDNGIVNGTSATTFSSDGDLTREQTATILYRYCKYKGYDVSASTDISSFPDAGKVGSYATDAIKWACAEGLLTGKPSGNVTILDPLGTATRSEVATILMRFCGKF